MAGHDDDGLADRDGQHHGGGSADAVEHAGGEVALDLGGEEQDRGEEREAERQEAQVCGEARVRRVMRCPLGWGQVFRMSADAQAFCLASAREGRKPARAKPRTSKQKNFPTRTTFFFSKYLSLQIKSDKTHAIMNIEFIGAAREVTGSKHLIRTKKVKKYC